MMYSGQEIHMGTSFTAAEQKKLLFEQYKLAVEMATGISVRRQAANNFYIGLVSGFGVLHSLFEKFAPTFSQSPRERVLLILPICLCVVWWLTIYSHRRIDKVKWDVICELENKLPDTPFTSETKKLGSKSFNLTKTELAIPILVGLVFLLLIVSSFLK
jgi:hypothetical protein